MGAVGQSKTEKVGVIGSIDHTEVIPFGEVTGTVRAIAAEQDAAAAWVWPDLLRRATSGASPVQATRLRYELWDERLSLRPWQVARRDDG